MKLTKFRFFKPKYNVKMSKAVTADDNCATKKDSQGVKQNGNAKELLESFNDQTTFHGIRYAFGKKSSFLQRIIWSILIMTCAGLVITDVTDRILHYLSSPKSINLDVVHNRSMIFPSVTICNQNAFRRTLAVENNHYELLTALYKDGVPGAASLRDEHLNISMDTLYTANAHRKEDLIVRCRWKNEECGPSNFTAILTKYGQCYTFNAINDDMMTVESPGLANGLELILNSEEYDYMVGPHTGGGIKVLLHGKDVFPMPLEYGYELPTGRHGFMDVKVYMETELPPPHGNCRQHHDHYFDAYTYTHGTCLMKLQNRFVMEKCGCRQFFIPESEGNIPICTMKELDCQTKAERDFQVMSRTTDCMASCSRLRYQPFLSYGSISVFARNKLNPSFNYILKDRFMQARELAFLEEDGFEKLLTYFDSLSKKQIPAFLLTLRQFEYIDIAFEKCFSDTKKLARVHYSQAIKCFQSEHPLYYTFPHTYSILSYGPFGVATNNIDEFFSSMHSQLYFIKQGNITSAMRSSYVKSAMETVEKKLSFVETLEGIDGVVVYMNALYPDKWVRGLENMTTEGRILIENETIISKNIYSEPQSFKSRKTLEILGKASTYLNSYYPIIANLNVTGKLDEKALNKTHKNLLKLVGQYNKEMKKLVKFHDHIISNFKHIEELLILIKAGFSEITDEINSKCDSMHYTQNIKAASQTLIYVTNLLHKYTTKQNISMTRISHFYLATEISYFIENLRGFATNAFGNLQTKMKPTTCLDTLIASYESMTKWYLVFKEYLLGMKPYSGDSCSKNLQNVKRFLTYFSFNVKVWHDILLTIEQIRETSAKYLESVRMDKSFYEQNFLHLNVLFQDLNYQHTTQQLAYDFFAMLGDIGGALGLFIGASVLTMFEVADLIFQIVSTRLSRRRNERKIIQVQPRAEPEVPVYVVQGME